MTSNWGFLLAAILMEVSGTTCMKLSAGFTRLVPSVLLFVFYVLSLGCLTMALRKIEISTAYAIWSGVGTVLITVVGVFVFKDSMSLGKAIPIALIVVGMVALKLQSAG